MGVSSISQCFAVFVLGALLCSCAPKQAPRPNTPPTTVDLGPSGGEWVRAMSWQFKELDGPKNDLETQLGDAFLRTIEGASSSPEYDCVAREMAAFYARYRASPDELLRRWMVGRCKAPDVFYWNSWLDIYLNGGAISVPFTAPELDAVVPKLITPHPPPKVTSFGVAMRAVDADAVAILVTADPPGTAHASVPDAQGALRIEIGFPQSQYTVRAVMNQGETASVNCQSDPTTDPSRYAFSCQMAASDNETWIEVLAATNRGDLERPTVDILAERPAATHADYRKPYVVLPPAANTADALLAGINGIRARAGAAPLRLATAQSRAVQEIQKAIFQIQADMDDDADNQVRTELLRGRAVDAPIFSARITLGIAYKGDAGDWLAARMVQPSSRETLMDPDADLLALATHGDPRLGFAVSAATYTLFDEKTEQRIADLMAARITKARGKLKMTRLTPTPDLSAVAGQVAAGAVDPARGFRAALTRMNLKSKQYFAGELYVLNSANDAPQFDEEVLQRPGLEYGLLVTHYKRPTDDWHHPVVFIWYATDRPKDPNPTL